MVHSNLGFDVEPTVDENSSVSRSSSINSSSGSINDFPNERNSFTKIAHEDEMENSSGQSSFGTKKFIASLDVGTTIIRCFIFNTNAEICASAEERVELLHPEPGHIEMDPEETWNKCQLVIQKTVECVGAENITSIGVCTQRGTFLLWDAVTGKPFHNLITWKDLRADALVKHWNKCFQMNCLRRGSRFLHFLTGSDRFLASSVLTFMNAQVVMRLKWVLENIAEMDKLIAGGRVRFGTLDTWIVHKLTQGKVYASDYSNASATAMFDPFLKEWSSFVLRFLGIPNLIFPELRPSCGDWGTCHPSVCGAALPITAVVSDQGASLAGGGGHSRGHLKITLGTGAFMNLNTGEQPLATVCGIYPVVGWQEPKGRVVFMAEASALDVGTVMEWGQRVGLYTDVTETAAIGASVPDSGGVYFVPAFQGLQAPVNDSTATCGFMGIKAVTTRAHLVRALLDSLSFLVYQMFEAMLDEARQPLLDARVDGGVSRNELIVQQIATLTQRRLTRYTTTQLSAQGTAVLAGLGAGVHKSASAVDALLVVERVFEPEASERPRLLLHYARWKKTCARFGAWTSSFEGQL